MVATETGTWEEATRTTYVSKMQESLFGIHHEKVHSSTRRELILGMEGKMPSKGVF